MTVKSCEKLEKSRVALTIDIVPLHGVLNIMTKHHVLMFVKIINFN